MCGCGGEWMSCWGDKCEVGSEKCASLEVGLAPAGLD